ncbi:MAG: glycosyltransferase, partial [Bacteroidetes bacterium]|nr:glycosyltransferase [Bacteroidota bacterium]
SIKVCALEEGVSMQGYPEEVKYTLDTCGADDYIKLVDAINADRNIEMVLIQHEFGFFQKNENHFLKFLYQLEKPVSIVFHTVLPHPNPLLKLHVERLANACETIVVMTKTSEDILESDYEINIEKVIVIPHGTHLVPHINKDLLKAKYQLEGHKVLSTFGLLSSGKGIETTLRSLPQVIELHPEVMFLIIGKTHPGVVASEGEKYRMMLEQIVTDMGIQHHVRFVNQYLPLDALLEYLQLTDIYIFTSLDPNQAVSGTFSYAMSCGCPIISTPIPHAKEVLNSDIGIIIDFQSSEQLAFGVNKLLSDEQLRADLGSSALQRITPTAWENSAIAHAHLFKKVTQQKFANSISKDKINLHYQLPMINLNHIKKMTTGVGMIQFSKINQPDLHSGYTLDDNARALIAFCMHYKIHRSKIDLVYIQRYLLFIESCQQPDGKFLNYIDQYGHFTIQNSENLSDANGRAIWALGVLISNHDILPQQFVNKAESILTLALTEIELVHSTRSMAFSIKGLYYYNQYKKSEQITKLIYTFAERIAQMYIHESEPQWEWFESLFGI